MMCHLFYKKLLELEVAHDYMQVNFIGAVMVNVNRRIHIYVVI